MSNKYKICDKCKKINVEGLIKYIKKLEEDADISVGCQNFCGICNTKAFIIFNNIPVIAEDEETLKLKIKDQLK